MSLLKTKLSDSPIPYAYLSDISNVQQQVWCNEELVLIAPIARHHAAFKVNTHLIKNILAINISRYVFTDDVK